MIFLSAVNSTLELLVVESIVFHEGIIFRSREEEVRTEIRRTERWNLVFL